MAVATAPRPAPQFTLRVALFLQLIMNGINISYEMQKRELTFKLLYGRSILSLFCAISDPSGGACGGSELSESDGFMKHPALDPEADDEPAFDAAGGLIR